MGLENVLTQILKRKSSTSSSSDSSEQVNRDLHWLQDKNQYAHTMDRYERLGELRKEFSQSLRPLGQKIDEIQHQNYQSDWPPTIITSDDIELLFQVRQEAAQTILSRDSDWQKNVQWYADRLQNLLLRSIVTFFFISDASNIRTPDHFNQILTYYRLINRLNVLSPIANLITQDEITSLGRTLGLDPHFHRDKIREINQEITAFFYSPDAFLVTWLQQASQPHRDFALLADLLNEDERNILGNRLSRRQDEWRMEKIYHQGSSRISDARTPDDLIRVLDQLNAQEHPLIYYRVYEDQLADDADVDPLYNKQWTQKLRQLLLDQFDFYCRSLERNVSDHITQLQRAALENEQFVDISGPPEELYEAMADQFDKMMLGLAPPNDVTQAAFEYYLEQVSPLERLRNVLTSVLLFEGDGHAAFDYQINMKLLETQRAILVKLGRGDQAN